MSVQSTQVGFRIRGIEPADLSTYPDRIKMMWWDWVVKYGLIAKDKDLAKGLGADGKPMKPLHPYTITHRKSEVGPVHKHAPPLIPALELSRVRSLLTGRAHTTSAEFWWKFDPITGTSFAEILRYQRDEYGRDVFGLSPKGISWTLARATKDWEAWKASPEAERLTAGRPGIPAARQVRKPLPKVTVRQNLEDFDLLPGVKSVIEQAIAEGRFPGFRRLNARGEQWKPGPGIPPAPGNRGPGPSPGPPKPRPAPRPAPMPIPPPRPSAAPVSAAFDVQIESNSVMRAHARIMQAIDKVHGDGALPRIPIMSNDRQDYTGFLNVTKSGQPTRMEIRKLGPHVHDTIAHETGHFLDYAGIPRTRPTFEEERNWRAEELFKDFFKAVDASESIKTLKLRATQNTIKTVKGSVVSDYSLDQKHIQYLLQENEIWARAYSQWIAYRSGQEDLLADHEYIQSREGHDIYPSQWKEADFQAIGKAMDAIFSKLGWLK